jgi:UTRA domain
MPCSLRRASGPWPARRRRRRRIRSWNGGSAAAAASCWTGPGVESAAPDDQVREYEDFYNTHRPHRPEAGSAATATAGRHHGSRSVPGPATRPRRGRDSRISPGRVGFRHLQLISPTEAQLEATGLYRLFRAAGINLHSATQSIGARNATAAESRLLEEKRAPALLTMTRTAYDDHGLAVEYGTHVYSASRYNFELTLMSS